MDPCNIKLVLTKVKQKQGTGLQSLTGDIAIRRRVSVNLILSQMKTGQFTGMEATVLIFVKLVING